MRVAQIELPLDPAPRLVFQLAPTIAIVDRLSLPLNQLKLDLVVELRASWRRRRFGARLFKRSR